MKNKFIIFGRPQITKNDIKEVVKVLKSGWIGTGPKTEEFEKKFAEYQNMKFAVATNSCTAALHLALDAIGIKKGDEVITTPITFAATANVITHLGAKPVFVDIDRKTLNIDADKIEKAITSRTKAILPVHMAGYPCDMDKINSLAKKHGLYVIGDCAHAIEAEYKGRKVGELADISCYSFYPTKNMTSGEGGMAVTNNKKWREMMKIKRLHGISKDAWKRYGKAGSNFYEVLYNGYKYNMTDIAAALGLSQFERLEKNWTKRNMLWQKYLELLKNVKNARVISLPDTKITRHAMHLFIILIDIDKIKISREKIIEKLKEKGIGTGIHFLSLHLQKYYKNAYNCKIGDYPEAEYVSSRVLSLPLDANLSADDIKYIVKSLKEIL